MSRSWCNILEKDWYEDYGFLITVVEEGNCRAFHKKGQKFEINDYTTPKGLCFETAHAIYPLLFAMRLDADVTKLGAEESNIRFFNCPAREIKFKIERFRQCNNCGKKIEKEELFDREKQYENYSLNLKVCSECAKLLE
ncbi:MAG: TIGR04076 family protein [Candidatus Heimdallarchaeota archaeon]|nr:TIGR04076 family protein [Candidatus Heimdallarchaeota archaeon]